MYLNRQKIYCVASCFIILVVIVYFVTKISNNNTPQKARWSLLEMDSPLQIKNIQELRLLNKELYITYEPVGGGGQQLLKSYTIDWDKNTMHFTKEYYLDKNARQIFYVPVTFWDKQGNMFVVERDEPLVYGVKNDSLYKTENTIISTKSDCPYTLALDVKYPNIESDNKYIFIGRMPQNGSRAIFRSVNNKDKQSIEELFKIIYNEKYPSWFVNHGTFAYNESIQKGAYAYMLFPAVQFFDFKNVKTKLVKNGQESFNPKTILEGDIWDSNPIHFKDITSNDKYLYCLYLGYSKQYKKQRKGESLFKSEILILNWDGEICKKLKTPLQLRNIAISSDGKYLIGYDGKKFLIASF